MSNTGGGAGGSLPPIYQPIIVTTSGAGQVGNTLRQVASQYGSQMSSMSRSTTGMYVTWRTFGDSLRQTGSLLKYTMAMPLMNLTKQAVQFSTQFEDSLAKIRGLVGVSADQTAAFGEQILKLGPAVGKGPVELADALYFITSAGIKGAEALDVLEASSKAASAGLGETQVVADAVTSVLNAYGEGTYSSMQATDILTAAVREGKAEASSFAPALGKVLPVASAFGLSFEDIAASVAALTRSGAEAGTSAIYLRQVLNTLLDPTLKAQKAMEGIGVSAATIRERIVSGDLLGALESLNQGFNGNVEAMAQVFGNVRALTAVFSLLGPNLESNRKIFDSINNTSGDTQKAFDEIAQTTGFKMKAASAEMQASLIKIGDAMAPVIKILADFGKIAARVFGFLAGNTGAARAIMVAAGLTAAFAGLIRTFASFVRLKALFQITAQAQATGLRNVYTNVITNIAAQKLHNAGLTQNTAATAANTTAQTTRTAAIGMVTTASGAQIPAIGASTAATTAQTAATNGAVIAQKTLAMQFAATAATMMTVIPLIGVAIAAFSLLKPLAGFLFKKGKKEKDSPIDVLNSMKEKGLDFGGYTKIGMNVKLDYSGSESEQNQKIEDFKEQYGSLMQKYINNGSPIEVRMAAALNIALVSGGGKDKDLNAQIARGLNIDPAKLEKEIQNLDIGKIVSSGLTQALANSKLYSAGAKNVTDPLLKEIQNVLDDEIPQLSGSEGLVKFIKNFGKSMAPAIESGNLGVFEGFIQEVMKTSTQFGSNVQLQGEYINNILDQAFNAAGFKKGDDLFSVLMENSANLPPALAEVANKLIEMRDNGQDMNLTGAQMISVFTGMVSEINAANSASEDNLSITQKVTEAYKDGINVELNETKSLFEATSEAIKKMKAAQDALYSPTFDLISSQTGLRDALRDVAAATKEAGGNLFAGTEVSDQALSSTAKAYQSVLEIANATFGATQDVDKASQAAGQAIAGIFNALTAGGASPETIKKFQDQFGNAFSLENIRKTIEGENPEALGKSQGEGIASGIISSIPTAQSALRALLNQVLTDGRLYIDSRSPSKLFAAEVGMPIGQGIAQGILLSSPAPQGAVRKVGQDALTAAKDFLQIQSPSKKFEIEVGKPISDGVAKGVIKAGSNVSDKAKEIVKNALDAAISNVKLLQNVFSSRLGFKKAQLDLVKFGREQDLAPTKLARAQRTLGRTERQFGAGGGTEVTSYEASKIEEAQKSVEKLRREYALGRAPLSDLIDAEENLAELRQTATEKAPEIVDAQNAVDDAQFQVTNSADLLAEKQVEVALKYGEMVTAAAEFNANAPAAAASFKLLAQEAKLGDDAIANVGTSIGLAKIGLGKLTDPLRSKEFQDALTTATDLIKGYIEEADKASKKNPFAGIDFTGGGTGPTTPTKTGPELSRDKNGNINVSAANFRILEGKLDADVTKSPTTITTGDTAIINNRPSVYDFNPFLLGNQAGSFRKVLDFFKAEGGPVSAGKTYVVGERGPELFTPSVNGSIVPNTELQRYTKNQTGSAGSSVTTNSFNVNVYNPVPETASDSIGRKLRDLSYAGLFG